MKIRNSYIIPSMNVVTTDCRGALMVSSDPESMSVHNTGATGESVMLSRHGNALWEDDEEE